MQDGIVGSPAPVEPDSAGIPQIFLSIGERNVVADQVIVGSIGQVNTVLAVVIGDVPVDRGIGGAIDVDARPGGARHRTAGVADMVVRDGDVVRAKNVNPIIRRAGYGETIDGDITFR